jgi:hypothetical protein
VTIDTEVVGPEGINHDEYDVRWRLGCGFPPTRQEQGEEHHESLTPRH